MNLAQAATLLDVSIPKDMHHFAPSEKTHCSIELIDCLQKQYNLFGIYYHRVKLALSQVRKNEALSIWLDAACSYYQKNDPTLRQNLPLPAMDGTLAGDFLSLFVMLPSVETTAAGYRARGFTREQIAEFFKIFQMDISIVEEHLLGRPAITPSYYRWLTRFLKGTIFDHGGLKFEMRKAAPNAYLIQNKISGKMEILSDWQKVHQSGMPFGSAGCEEEDGSFSAVFTETATAYIGHKIEHHRISRKECLYPKEQWVLFLKPNDHVIGIHIPRKTDLTPEKIRKAYQEAQEIAARCYPEYRPKAFYCSSWMLDPSLNEMLGKNSRISQFSAPFLRYPNRSDGQDVFTFVFHPSDFQNLASLPEKTTLHRKLKEKYLKGEYIYTFTGLLPFDKI